MGPGVKEDKTVPKGQSQFFKLSIMFFILNISNFVVPVPAFSLRTCHISHNKALCNKGNLKAVPRDIPPTVQGLDLSLNKISRIQQSDFKNLVLLTELDLKGNDILEIASGAFADLISLNKLNLNSNKLVKLGEDLFDGLSNLTELRIHRNGIKVVAPSAFKSLTSLTFLDMSYNKLDHLTKVNSLLQHLPNLRYLSIQNNNLGTFRSWELTNSSLQLNSLDVSQNPIAVFAITANVFPNLTLLSIGNGTQEMTWEVFNNTFLSQVSTLDISGLKMKFHDMKKLLENVNSSLTSLRMNAMTQDLAALTNITCTIPTLSKLQLRDNKLKFLRSDLFQSCSNITELDIAENKMLNIQDEAFRAVQGLRILDLSRNRLSSVPAAIRNLVSLEELNLSSNNISILGCHEFANLAQLKDLSLYLNSISALNACVFKGLIQLKVLKLQNNHISNLGGAFKKYLPNLRQLQLDENKLTTIKYTEFKGLRSLQLLSLHDNQIQKLENGCFSGLISLTDIKLQSNKIGKKDITNGCLKDLTKLTRLDLRNNHIQFNSNSPLSDPPFSKLSRLEILEIPSQHHRGKSHLPSNFLQGLTKLLKLNIRNIQLLSLPKGMFNYTPRLEELDISSNDLVDLSPDLFFPIRGLKSLYISRTSLRSLDFLIDAGLTKVEFLQSRKNEYSVISEEVMKSLPALVYVDLKGNSFTCDCDNSWFLQWAENNNHTQVFDAYNFECNYPPDLKGMRLLDLDVQSCTVNIDFICFVTTTCIILLFMVMSFTYHFLRWHLAYAYYFFLAYLFDSKHKNKQAPNQYDAFISYNYHDEPWVMRELLPKLEGEQGWKLCLHHRDFEPGKFIIDNITDAIYGSRKTICVISHKYLESEWCSREIQVASFRLFDEMKDMLILVFLEDIPIHQLSPYYRMRKLLKKQTYLSWPQAGGNTEVFWKKLHQALTTRRDESPKDRFCTTLVDRP